MNRTSVLAQIGQGFQRLPQPDKEQRRASSGVNSWDLVFLFVAHSRNGKDTCECASALSLVKDWFDKISVPQ